ncbi:MAG: class C beta-lactamase-related serine hydrolase [Deltaproteobacteria bacterium]|nr:MAG: class C beta-lactamase-related serine hydrolase [Deltaproteobacteria bacterium]
MHRPVLLLTLAACSPRIDFGDQAIPLTEVWGQATPSDEALARYQSAADYAEEHRAVEMLVLHGSDVVFEWTREDYDPTTPRHLFSGTKSFGCAVGEVLGAQDRLDLDAPVADALPSLAAGRDVTARQLLQFTSGVAQDKRALTKDGLREEQRIDDKYAYAVGLDAAWPAGSHFEYGSSHLSVFGALVEEVTDGEDAVAVLDAEVFAPLDFRYGGWHRDPDGHPMLAYGAWTTAHEWAKYGVLLRDDGLWQGQRVLPEGVRERCTSGSVANPAYGHTLWLNQPIEDTSTLAKLPWTIATDGEPILHPGGYPDAFAAAGFGDQRLYVFPSEDLVVVLLSDGSLRFRDREFATRLLP